MFNKNFAYDWIRTADFWCRSDRSTNWATTTAHYSSTVTVRLNLFAISTHSLERVNKFCFPIVASIEGCKRESSFRITAQRLFLGRSGSPTSPTWATSCWPAPARETSSSTSECTARTLGSWYRCQSGDSGTSLDNHRSMTDRYLLPKLSKFKASCLQ